MEEETKDMRKTPCFQDRRGDTVFYRITIFHFTQAMSQHRLLKIWPSNTQHVLIHEYV